MAFISAYDTVLPEKVKFIEPNLDLIDKALVTKQAQYDLNYAKLSELKAGYLNLDILNKEGQNKVNGYNQKIADWFNNNQNADFTNSKTIADVTRQFDNIINDSDIIYHVNKTKEARRNIAERDALAKEGKVSGINDDNFWNGENGINSYVNSKLGDRSANIRKYTPYCKYKDKWADTAHKVGYDVTSGQEGLTMTIKNQDGTTSVVPNTESPYYTSYITKYKSSDKIEQAIYNSLDDCSFGQARETAEHNYRNSANAEQDLYLNHTTANAKGLKEANGIITGLDNQINLLKANNTAESNARIVELQAIKKAYVERANENRKQAEMKFEDFKALPTSAKIDMSANLFIHGAVEGFAKGMAENQTISKYSPNEAYLHNLDNETKLRAEQIKKGLTNFVPDGTDLNLDPHTDDGITNQGIKDQTQFETEVSTNQTNIRNAGSAILDEYNKINGTHLTPKDKYRATTEKQQVGYMQVQAVTGSELNPEFTAYEELLKADPETIDLKSLKDKVIAYQDLQREKELLQVASDNLVDNLIRRNPKFAVMKGNLNSAEALEKFRKAIVLNTDAVARKLTKDELLKLGYKKSIDNVSIWDSNPVDIDHADKPEEKGAGINLFIKEHSAEITNLLKQRLSTKELTEIFEPGVAKEFYQAMSDEWSHNEMYRQPSRLYQDKNRVNQTGNVDENLIKAERDEVIKNIAVTGGSIKPGDVIIQSYGILSDNKPYVKVNIKNSKGDIEKANKDIEITDIYGNNIVIKPGNESKDVIIDGTNVGFAKREAEVLSRNPIARSLRKTMDAYKDGKPYFQSFPKTINGSKYDIQMRMSNNQQSQEVDYRINGQTILKYFEPKLLPLKSTSSTQYYQALESIKKIESFRDPDAGYEQILNLIQQTSK